MPTRKRAHSREKSPVRLFGAMALIYLLFSYGGVRSPDSEVVYRTASALARHGSWALSSGLEWQGFGLAPGRDGARYSVFGPGQALLLAPLVAAARGVSRAWNLGDSVWVPSSHYVPGGLRSAVTGAAPEAIRPHVERLLVSLVNPVLGAATVVLFYLLCRRLSGSTGAAQFAALLYGLGTLQLSYAGTLFSEVPSTLFVLLCFHLLLLPRPRRPLTFTRAAWAGAALGAAVLTHLTAVLCAPFALSLAALGCREPSGGSLAGPASRDTSGTLERYRSASLEWRPALGFAAALGMALLVLGLHNYMRFGNWLETGRTLTARAETMGYGTFVWPGPGLSGLLLSAGKGLIWYCPAVLLGLLCLPALYRARPLLTGMIMAMVSTRILFIACRSDWHGGFCLGPRYLVMVLPFLILPCAVCAADLLARGRRTRFVFLSIAAFACALEQMYLGLGEVFTFLHMLKWTALARHVDIFADASIYRSWDFAPLLHLLQGRRGPWLLQRVPLTDFQLLALMAVLLGAVWIALTRRWLQQVDEMPVAA